MRSSTILVFCSGRVTAQVESLLAPVSRATRSCLCVTDSAATLISAIAEYAPSVLVLDPGLIFRAGLAGDALAAALHRGSCTASKIVLWSDSSAEGLKGAVSLSRALRCVPLHQSVDSVALSQEVQVALSIGPNMLELMSRTTAQFATLSPNVRREWEDTFMNPQHRTVKAIAHRCGCSERHLERLFIGAGLPTPGSLLRQARIARAVDARFSGASVAEAARSAGWADSRSFSRALRGRLRGDD